MKVPAKKYSQVRVEPKLWLRLKAVKNDKWKRVSLTALANSALEIGLDRLASSAGINTKNTP